MHDFTLVSNTSVHAYLGMLIHLHGTQMYQHVGKKFTYNEILYTNT